ncbi:GNAT family N-acetyltransferase, partial [Streptomyces sp. NPDC056159]|uniref:GNAT family N-acetyltransferase n=1 Tax=Streptomyces sp. NPDC056159 TaxID=3155537 RepID=UPI00343B50BE
VVGVADRDPHIPPTTRTDAGEGLRTVVDLAKPNGEWVGSVTVLVEEAGTTDWAGFPVERRQGHVVGVYVRPEHRGCGLTEVLFDEALQWAWDIGVERVRLIVHEDNGRALRFYRRIGFLPSGVTVPLTAGSAESELEYVLERR